MSGIVTHIGMGSNVGHRHQTLQRAVDHLALKGRVRPVRVSTVYESAPQGVTDQPDFLNAVLEAETDLVPRALLDHLLALERQLGRVRLVRWGPRTIDMDILLYGRVTANELGLVIPHPRMYERAFVVVPLAELSPHLVGPDGRPLSELATALRTVQHLRPVATLSLPGLVDACEGRAT